MNKYWTRVALFLSISLLFYFLSNISGSIVTVATKSNPDFRRVENIINGDLAFTKNIGLQVLHKYGKNSIEEIYQFYDDSLRGKASKIQASIFLFTANDLIFWTDNIDVDGIKEDTLNSQLVQTQNSWYIANWYKYKEAKVLTLLMLKHDFPYQNRFLKNTYNSRYNSLEGWSIGSNSATSQYTLNLNNGCSILLSKDRTSSENLSSTLMVAFQWLSFLFFMITIFLTFRTKYFKRNPLFYSIALTIIVALIRVVSLLEGFPSRGFNPLFSPEIYAHSTFYPSLGDYLVNALLIFIVVVSIYKSFVSIGQFVIKGKYKILFAFISSVVVWGIFFIADSVFSSLITHSTITLETYRVFNLSIYSLVGYIGISLWVATTIIVSDLWVFIFKEEIEESKLAIIALVGFIVVFSATIIIGAIPSIYGFLWSILIFCLLFVIRSRRYSLSNTWFLVIICLLSFYAVLIVSDYSYRKDRDVRKVLAINLSNERDPVAETLFGSLTRRLESDTTIMRYLNNMQKHDIEMYAYLQKEYFNDYYKKYDFRATVCSPGSDLIMDNADHRVDCNGFFTDLISVYGINIPRTHFFFLNTQNGRISYVGYAEYKGKLNNTRLYIEFDSKLSREVLGYPELLLDGKLSSNSKLSDYSTAKYHNEQLITQTGSYPYRLLNSFTGDSIGEFTFINQGGYNHLVYRNDSDDIVVLSRPRENILNTTASFAYVFFFFYIIMFLWLKVADYPIRIGLTTPSFKLRIKTAMILVVLLSLILVATVSILYSIYSFRKKNIDNLSEKLISVMVDIEKDLSSQNLLSESNRDLLSNKLLQLSNVFYTDINLYDVSGDLISTSRPEIFERKLLGRKMNPVAWHEMAYVYNPKLIHEERIGSMNYLSAYIPLIDQNSSIIAYLNLPYFTRQGELVVGLYSVIVAIVNIYVLLTLFAFIIAVVISNQISKPLELIREKIRNVDIASHNEPLKYNSNDEVGMLVKEYNRMVLELADSAEKLARSQRESAWREMAKQIAHEIKNPLTPMKLSLQHLVKAKREGVAGWDDLFQKFSTSLVDQINTLSNIATEFSNFAKMPVSSIVEVEINSIIDEVLTLFSGYSNVRFSYINHCTGINCVLGDREQLFRVFVNLVKNAVQSIERGKKGEIKIELSCNSGKLLAVISDNGKGISEDIRPKLFSPNFTTKSGGMGLGLAIVKGIIENTGGRIWFDTELGVGTKFYVELPLSKS